MTVSIRQIHPHFVGEVSNINLRKPLTRDEVDAVNAGMDQYAVLVFHGQDITDDQQLAFTANFGPMETTGSGNITRPQDQRLKNPHMIDVSNLNREQKRFARDDRQRMFNLGNRLWPSDSSFKAIPAKYSLLSGRTVVEKGGNTEFADMRWAYDTLDAETKAEVADLICEHSLIYSRGWLGFTELTEEERVKFTPVRQRLVRTNAVTQRKSLYLSSHIGTIIGWPMPEARAFIRDLTDHATVPQNIYAHDWQQHDFVIWDNRQTMHRVRRFDETLVRDMRRTTVAGDGPTPEQVKAP